MKVIRDVREILMAAAVAVLAVGALWFALSTQHALRAIEADGVETIGTVEARVGGGKSGNRWWRYDYRYTDRAGTLRQGSSTTYTRETVQAPVGGKITVVYSRSRPHYSTIDREGLRRALSNYALVATLFCVLALLAGAWQLLLWWLRQPQNRTVV